MASCEHCPATGPVLVEMAPGRDGQPWWLCVACWKEGRRPFIIGNLTTRPRRAEPPMVSAEMGDALEKSGWKVSKGHHKPKRKGA